MQDDEYLWDPKATADPDIARIEDALRPLRLDRPDLSFDKVSVRNRHSWRWAAAAAGVVLLAGGLAFARMTVDPWAVRALTGTAMVDRSRVDAKAGIEARMAEGDWLETDGGSRVEVNVGRIGRAEFGPGSRVQLVRAEAREHRLSLVRGTMHARIWAPPRFFLVQTANALAVDLGCVYSLSVDEHGVGELVVESGEVELIEGTRRALVPAGNMVSITPGTGPGLPMRTTASREFQDAVHRLEARLSDDTALDMVLALSTPATSMTLWHLLQRVDVEDRERVYTRLSTLAPVPRGIAPPAMIALKREALRAWKESLEDGWTVETIPWWKRNWRKAWTFILTFG